MLKKAIEKIKSEMDQNKNSTYIQVVGAFLLKHLKENPGAAEKVLVQDKTIAKSLDEMRKAAEKKKVGSCAVLTDQEGFEVVLKYFGIETGIKQAPAEPKEESAPIKKNATFDAKLEDLLS